MNLIREITSDSPGYDEDDTEFITLNGIPLTGILKDFHKGHLSSITSFFNGRARGYYVWYYTSGPSIGAVQVVAQVDGIRISFDEVGAIVSVDKHCFGRVLERMKIVEGRCLVETVMDRHKRDEIFSRFPKDTEYCRREPIQDLYEEAMRRFREGTLFEEDWLYTEDQYYDLPGSLLS